MTAGVKRIERANVILAVAFTALAGVVWGPRGTLAAAAGALGGLAFALIGKMTALFVLVFLALRVAHLAVMPFGLGFSVLVISILLVSLTGHAVEAEAQTR